VTNRDRIMRVQAAFTAGVLVAAVVAIASVGAPASNATGVAAPTVEPSPGPPSGFDATPSVVRLDQSGPPTPVRHRPPRRGATVSAPTATFTLPSDLDTSSGGIPRRVLAAFVNATRNANASDPACQLQWQTLAAIGYIESDDALSGGSANPSWDGVAVPPILGPLLNGRPGIAAVPDTDHGELDGNARWDRAVGPMQFLPSTWTEYAADGNGDGVSNPQDIDDATLAAADYLCSADSHLDQRKPMLHAILAYNHSTAYVREVVTVAAHYEHVRPGKLGIDGPPRQHRKKADKPRGQAWAPPPEPLPVRSSSAPRPPAATTAAPTSSPTATATPTKPPPSSATATPSEGSSPTPCPDPGSPSAASAGSQTDVEPTQSC
jgi:membrane-bound lytic murein transglycosylase B